MREGFTRQRCPKCGGNIFLYKDSYGWYEQCLQCSRLWYLDSIVGAQDKVSTTNREELRLTPLPSKSQ